MHKSTLAAVLPVFFFLRLRAEVPYPGAEECPAAPFLPPWAGLRAAPCREAAAPRATEVPDERPCTGARCAPPRTAAPPACLGCAVALNKEDGTQYFGHVCKDGPVFESHRVAW